MLKRPRWLNSSHLPQRSAPPCRNGEQAQEPSEPPPGLRGQALTDWAFSNPEEARRYLRQKKLERRQPAPIAAFSRAFFLVLLGDIAYGAVVARRGLFEKYEWDYTFRLVGLFLVVWLMLWVLIVAWRRRS